MLNDRVAKKNIHAMIWIGPTLTAKYLDDKILAKADRLWDKTKRAVAVGSQRSPDRVKIARLSEDYAVIERARAGGARMYKVDNETFAAKPDADFQARVRRFFEVARRGQVTRMDQGGLHARRIRVLFNEV